MADPAEIHENGVQQVCNTEAVADAGTQDDPTIPPKEAWRLLVRFPLHPDREAILFLLFTQFEGPNPPTDAVIESGLLPGLIEHIGTASFNVQYFTYRILANVPKYATMFKLVPSSVMSALLDGVPSKSAYIAQFCWLGLSRIVERGGVACRDKLIQSGVIPKFVDACQGSSKFETCVAYALSRMAEMLCRYSDDQISREIQTAIIPCLLELIKHPDYLIIVGSIDAFVLLCSEDDDQLVFLNSFNVVGVVVKLLEHPHTDVVFHALSACFSFVRGSTKQAVLDHGILGHLPRIFGFSELRFHFKLCKVLLHILDGSDDDMQAVYDAGIIPFLMKELEHEEFDVKCAAIICFSQICLGHSSYHCFQLGRWRLIPVITPFLAIQHIQLQQCTLFIIGSILTSTIAVPREHFKFMEQFWANGGLGFVNTIRQTGAEHMQTLAIGIQELYATQIPRAA